MRHFQLIVSSLIVSSLVAALASDVRAGGVRIVEPTGTANFADVQSAVNAASDGNVILIGPGTYGGFSIAGKSLVVAAAKPGTVMIHGALTISSLAPTQRVVLSGLDVSTSAWVGQTWLIRVSSALGHVRFQDCEFEETAWSFGFCGLPPEPGAVGVRIENSPRVAFSSCKIVGGHGGDFDSTDDCHCHPAGAGGAGLELIGSTVALYDCKIDGGTGGGSECTAQVGGPGALVHQSSALFASSTTITGGRGGSDFFYFAQSGGTGGDGVVFDASGSLLEIGCTLAGGPGGWGEFQGSVGAPFSGGAPTSLAGPARVAASTPYVGGDVALWSVAFQGAPGDKVYALGSLSPGFQISPAFHGAWLVLRSALLPIVALGAVDASGALSGTVSTGDLPAGSLVQVVWGQVAARATVGAYLASPAVFVVLDRQSGPDCNANGIADLVEVIEGTAPDANGNLIPDGCPGG